MGEEEVERGGGKECFGVENWRRGRGNGRVICPGEGESLE